LLQRARAAECADLLQRSSSCVEGRNGQLALHHRDKHRLSNRKRDVLTAVHNYFIRRPDGTTAAARFFGQPRAPMFAYLLAALDPPPQPARERPRPPRVRQIAATEPPRRWLAAGGTDRGGAVPVPVQAVVRHRCMRSPGDTAARRRLGIA
jgi:hypothetical protein